MLRSVSERKWMIFFLAFTSLAICISFITVQTSGFSKNPDLFSLAVTFDITIAIPLLYFIITKKLKLIPVTVILVFFLCTLIAGWILPAQHQTWLDKVRTLLILAESFIMIYAIIRIRKIIITYKKLSIHLNDFMHNLENAVQSVLGTSGAISVFLSEINTLRYGLFFWLGK